MQRNRGNNRMGKTRYLLKKIRGTKGNSIKLTLHCLELNVVPPWAGQPAAFPCLFQWPQPHIPAQSMFPLSRPDCGPFPPSSLPKCGKLSFSPEAPVLLGHQSRPHWPQRPTHLDHSFTHLFDKGSGMSCLQMIIDTS